MRHCFKVFNDIFSFIFNLDNFIYVYAINVFLMYELLFIHSYDIIEFTVLYTIKIIYKDFNK